MNPSMLNLTFVYYPDTDDDPVVIAETKGIHVPRVGESIMMDVDEAEKKGITNAWEVIDVYYELPKEGGDGVLQNVTVYIDPSEDEDEDEI